MLNPSLEREILRPWWNVRIGFHVPNVPIVEPGGLDRWELQGAAGAALARDGVPRLT